MIGKNDFIEAIGKPDAGFTEAVDSALAVIRAREENKKPRRYYMILPVMAAAAIFVVFLGAALKGSLAPKAQPDSVMSQPKITPFISVMPTASAEEIDTGYGETPQPTLEAEQPYVTEAPLYEEMVEQFTPPPVTYEYLDGNIAMQALDIFSYSIPALYPGFELGNRSIEMINAYGVHQECAAQWINNDSFEMAVEWVALRAPQFLPEYFADEINNTQFYAVSIDVPSDPQRIGAFIGSGCDWLRNVYDAGMARVNDALGGTDDFMLTGITIYLDESCVPCYCELYFDGQPAAYLLYLIEMYDSGEYNYALLLDEYDVYSFNDIFGDPDVVVTAEPTRIPADESRSTPEPAPISVNIRDHIVSFRDEDSMLKIYNAYMPLLLALNPEHESYTFSYETVTTNGMEMDCHALRMDTNGVAAWITMDAPEYEPANGSVFYTLNIPVDLAMDEIDNAINAGDGLLAAVYEESRKLAYEYAAEMGIEEKDMLLRGIKLYLDEYVDPTYCEMYFGSTYQHRSLWKMGDDVADILETGMNDVRFDGKFGENAAETNASASESASQKDFLTKIGEALGLINNSSIGIIGGADGPTNIFVGKAIRFPELPDYYQIFTDVLGVELTELWPGSVFTGVTRGTVESRGVSYPCEYWVLDREGEFTPAWLSWGEVINGSAWEGEYECPTLSIVMPDDPDQIEAFMSTTDEWMYDLYFKSRDYVSELVYDDHAMYNGWKLAGMKLTFDELQRVKICELFFGEESKIYFQWVYNEDRGVYGLMTQYFDENGEYFGDYFAAPAVFGMPEDKDMFAYAFGQTIDVLYPDNDGIYIHGDSDYSEVFVKYGSGSTRAFTVSYGKIYDSEKNADVTDFVSVNAYMPDDETKVEIFMADTPAWLMEIYAVSQSETEMPLANLIMTIDPEGNAYCIELIFGRDETSYVRWMRAPDGTFYIAESGGSEIVE